MNLQHQLLHHPYLNPHTSVTLDPRYLSPLLEEIVSRTGRYLTIGCFMGHTESLAIRNGWKPDAIALLDIDQAEYSLEQDGLAYAYQNICARSYGAYRGEFMALRADSQDWSKLDSICAFGPYSLIYIDGLHTAEAVYRDLDFAKNNSTSGAKILVHDVRESALTVRGGFERWLADNKTTSVVVREDVLLGLGVIHLP